MGKSRRSAWSDEVALGRRIVALGRRVIYGWHSAAVAAAMETQRTPFGTGMQQAREPSVEQTVEVVRNHEGGT